MTCHIRISSLNRSEVTVTGEADAPAPPPLDAPAAPPPGVVAATGAAPSRPPAPPEEEEEEAGRRAVGEAAAAVAGGSKVTSRDMFQLAQRPLQVGDLPREAVEGKSARQLIGILHAAAVERRLDMYVDPLSGYPAFSKLYLQRRECCGNKCRHCPWGHRNVPAEVEW